MADGQIWTDKGLEAALMPAACQIIENLFQAPAAVTGYNDDDYDGNADIICRGQRIGVRFRRHNYLWQYGLEFTLRLKRETGIRTEWDKFAHGLGDYLLYGFADPAGTELAQWELIDYSKLRQYVKYNFQRYGPRCFDRQIHKNLNGAGSSFISFKIADCPACLAAASFPWGQTAGGSYSAGFGSSADGVQV